MNIFILIAMVLLLAAALERNNRRQTPKAPGLNGSYDRDDRDWARTKLDLIALDSQAEPSTDEPLAFKGSGPTSTDGTRPTPKPAQPRWNTINRNGPRAA